MAEHNLSAELKQRNRNNIYRLLLQEECVSKQNIMQKLRLSLPTITQNLSELTGNGLICEQGSFGNTGGRRAKGYAAVSDAKVAVGIDLNKHHFSTVILDLRGNIIARMREYTNFEKNDSYYMYIANAVYALIAENGIPDEKVLGVGIAVQGIIAADGKTVSYGEVLGITGLTLDEVGKYIRYPKALFHDSDMAAQAEFWASPEDKNAVYISLSTNLGGALIGAPSIVSESSYGLARIEHMTLIAGGKQCYCGQSGCADAYCSTSFLTAQTPDGRLETFFGLLKAGDALAVSAWEEYMRYLSVLINNARMMFDAPVVLGGYLAEYLDEYLDMLKRMAYARNSFDHNCDYIRLSKIITEPISFGAALQYVSAFIATV